MKILLVITSLTVLLLAQRRSQAADLYNLDFTPPEVGTYQVVFGAPSVQASIGPFTDALMFHAVVGYDQIQLPVNVAALRYQIQYDVFVHNLLDSQYGFRMLLDTPEAYSIGFHGGLDQQYFGPGGNLGSFQNDQVYHMFIDYNLQAHTIMISANGVQLYNQPMSGSSLNAIRFSMDPVIGGARDGEGTYAALDNVVVSAIPEPSFVLLTVFAGALFFIRGRRPGRI